MDVDLSSLESHWNCRLTTRGRRSGQAREATIWFALGSGVVYLTGSASHPHWCRNLEANPEVSLRIGEMRLEGVARVARDADEAGEIRQNFVERYLLARLSRIFGGYTDSIPVIVESLTVA